MELDESIKLQILQGGKRDLQVPIFSQHQHLIWEIKSFCLLINCALRRKVQDKILLVSLHANTVFGSAGLIPSTQQSHKAAVNF